MPDSETPGADLLDRYFADACTPAEIARVRAWALRSRDGEAGLEALRQLRIAEIPASWDLDTRWAKIIPHLTGDSSANASLEVTSQPQRMLEPRMRTTIWTGTKTASTLWYTFAGSCAVILLCLFVWREGVERTKIAPSTQWSTYTTAKGKQATITLPDGSVVLLNVASQLEVPTDYDRGNRTLRLTGEALFTVTNHAGAPFIVRTGSSTTRVLGTSFIVRNYTTDTAATIAVRDGKVMVQSQVLTTAQYMTVSARGMSPVRAASPSQFSFASGVLMLSGVPLPDAIPQLNRWYDADIRLGDSTLMVQKVVGGFKAGSLTDLSAILEMTFDVHIVRDGRVLTLYPGKH